MFFSIIRKKIWCQLKITVKGAYTKKFTRLHTKIVTASLTTPAIVTVTALVIDTRTYSVNTCKITNTLNFLREYWSSAVDFENRSRRYLVFQLLEAVSNFYFLSKEAVCNKTAFQSHKEETEFSEESMKVATYCWRLSWEVKDKVP